MPWHALQVVCVLKGASILDERLLQTSRNKHWPDATAQITRQLSD